MKYKIDVLEVDTSKVTVASPTRYKAVVTVMNEGVSEDTFLLTILRVLRQRLNWHRILLLNCL